MIFIPKDSGFFCDSAAGPVWIKCDAEDLPKFLARRWRFQKKRGLVMRAGGSQMQATSLLCGWTQVRFANGDRSDLRRENLARLITRGAAPKCRPMRVRENLWRVVRNVGAVRLQKCFSDFAFAVAEGKRMAALPKEAVVAEFRDRQKARAPGLITFEQFFAGRGDANGLNMDFEAMRQMSHRFEA